MIDDIIDSVLETIRTTVDEPSSIYHGVAKLITKKERTFPKVIKTDTTISMDDNWGLQLYARVLDTRNNDDSQRGFGRKLRREMETTVRVVVIADIDYGYEVVESLYNALPDAVGQTSPATYKYMLIDRGEIDRDHSGIALTEFAEIEEKQLHFHLYAFEFNLIYIPC